MKINGFVLLFVFPKAFEKMLRLGNQEFKLKIVDTAGHDEYSIFPQSLTVTIHGYVLVYTVTSQKR